MDIPLPEECVAAPLPQNAPPEFDIPLPSYVAAQGGAPPLPPSPVTQVAVPPPLPGLPPGHLVPRAPPPLPLARPPGPPPMRAMLGPPPRFLSAPPLPQGMVGPPPPLLMPPSVPRPPPTLPPAPVQPVEEAPPAAAPEKPPPEQNDESNKYSPSHASAEDDVPQQSLSKAQLLLKSSNKPRTAVLGKAQAKKRLLAFSMTKQGGAAGLSFGFAKKAAAATKPGAPPAKEFAGAPATPDQQPQQPQAPADEDKAAKPEKPAAPIAKKKANRKGSAREDKARSVIAAIEEIKREELVMRGVLSFTSLDTKCTGDMTAPIPLPGQPYVPPPPHGPLRSRELDMMAEILTERQREKELLVEELLSRDQPKPSTGKDEKAPAPEVKPAREEKKESGGGGGRSRRERSHSREKKRRSSKDDRHGRSRKEGESRRSAPARPTEMPTSWAQFTGQGYLFEEVRRIKAKQEKPHKDSAHDRTKRHGSRDRRSRSREKKHRRSSPSHESKDKDGDEDNEVTYKLLSFPSKMLSPLYAASTGQGTKAYPRVIVKVTKTRPVVTYCENPNGSTAFLKTRKEVFAESPQEVVKLMELIMEGGAEKSAKKVEKSSSRASDASLSNSLAALQVSYDEGELDENLSSDDIPAGRKRDRPWFCLEKDWFSEQTDADAAGAGVNGVLAKEPDGVVDEADETDEEADRAKDRKSAPEFAGAEKKYSPPASDHKPEAKRLSLSEPPVECIKVRSKWDSDYEEDALSIDNEPVAASSAPKAEEVQAPYLETAEDVKMEEAAVEDDEPKVPENMEVSGESGPETSESPLVNDVAGDAEPAVDDCEDEAASEGVAKDDEVAEPIHSSESEPEPEPEPEQPDEPPLTPERAADSPEREDDAGPVDGAASTVGSGSERNADLKLVSEYEEFMKAVSFDTCFADDAAAASEEDKADGTSDVFENDAGEELRGEPTWEENESKGVASVDDSDEKQSSVDLSLVPAHAQSESVDTEYNDVVEETLVTSPTVQESKSDEMDENNVDKIYDVEGTVTHEDKLAEPADSEAPNLRSRSSGSSDLDPPEENVLAGPQKEIVDDEAVDQNDESGTEKTTAKKGKRRKEGHEDGDPEKPGERPSKADVKKSKQRGKHVKRRRKYTKTKHSKKKVRRKRESSTSESSSDTESSSSEEEKSVKQVKRRDKRSRPSVSSEDSSSDESTTSSSMSTSTQSSSSSSSNDRRSRKKKRKQKKKVRVKRSSKKNRKDKVTRRKHRKRKVEESESDYEDKSSKSNRRKEGKQSDAENVTREEKVRRKHKSQDGSSNKAGSSDKNTIAAMPNNKGQLEKDDKKSRTPENSVSASFEADDSSVESCWEASVKEKRAREKLKRERAKLSRASAGSDDDNENNRKRRRKEHRSRSSSPKKKRRRSPSTSPERSPAPKARGPREGKARHQDKQGAGQEARKLHGGGREKKRSRKDEREDSVQSKDQKESSKPEKQGSDSSKSIKMRKRKKDSREQADRRGTSKPRDRSARSKSKDEREKLKYKEKKGRNKSKEKRKDKRHKEKTSKHRYKDRDDVESSDDEVQARRKSFRSRYYRYRSKGKEMSEKKKVYAEDEGEKGKYEKHAAKNEDSDVNDSDNQDTENEDSENEETGNEDSENEETGNEDSENGEDSENKEDSENHESEEDNDSENEGSDNQSTSDGEVDDNAGSVNGQFDLFREIKQEVFSEDDVPSEKELRGPGEVRKLVVCKEERVDSSEAVNSVRSSDVEMNGAAQSSDSGNVSVHPRLEPAESCADVPESLEETAALAASKESEECPLDVEASADPSSCGETVDVAEAVIPSVEEMDEASEESSLKVLVSDHEVRSVASVTNSEADRESSCFSEASFVPVDMVAPKANSPPVKSAVDEETRAEDVLPVDLPVVSLAQDSSMEEKFVTAVPPVKDEGKISDSVALYSPGAMYSDDEEDDSKSVDQVAGSLVCKDGLLSPDVLRAASPEACSDMSLDSETCQVKPSDSPVVKDDLEAPDAADSYTADFFCGLPWDAACRPGTAGNPEVPKGDTRKNPVCLENIPLPPPKYPPEANVISVPSAEVAPLPCATQGHVDSKPLDASYPVVDAIQPPYPPVPPVQPCPPPLPPVESSQKSRPMPKTPGQKHVITVKLLSSVSRQEALSAATREAVSVTSNSEPTFSDSGDKIEDLKSPALTVTDTSPATGVDKNLADAGPWKAFGTLESGSKPSLYDGVAFMDGDLQVSSSVVKPEVAKDELGEQLGVGPPPASPEAAPKRARKRPSRWGMMTPPAKDAYHVLDDKSRSSLPHEEAGGGEKRPGPIFQILRGEKTSSGSSSLTVDIKKLENADVAPGQKSSAWDVGKPESKVLKVGPDVAEAINAGPEKSSADNETKDDRRDRRSKERSKLKEHERDRRDRAKSKDSEKSGSDGDKGRHRRDRDRDRHRDKVKDRDRGGDRDRSRNKERERKHRDQSRERDDKDAKKVSDKRSSSKGSEVKLPGADCKEVPADQSARVERCDYQQENVGATDSTGEPHCSERGVMECNENRAHPQDIPSDRWETWSAQHDNLNLPDADWQHDRLETPGQEYNTAAAGDSYPTAEAQEGSWHTRIVTYCSRSPTPSSTWDKSDSKDPRLNSRRVKEETNAASRDLFEHHGQERDGDKSWRGGVYKRSFSRSPPARHRGHGSPPASSPSPLRRSSRSPSFVRAGARSSRSPAQRYSPFRGRSCSPYGRRSRSPPSRRPYSPAARRSPPQRWNRSPVSRRSMSRSPRTSVSPRFRSRSPAPRQSPSLQRRNRSPTSRRSLTPQFRRSRSFSPGAGRSRSPRSSSDVSRARNAVLPSSDNSWGAAASPPATLKRSLADSTISDSELPAAGKVPQAVPYPLETHEAYYGQGVPILKDCREESLSPAPVFSPRRLSLDDRIRMELGAKMKSPPPPLQQMFHHEFQGQYHHPYYLEHGDQQPPGYGALPPRDDGFYGRPPHVPVGPKRALLPTPVHIKPEMSQWCGPPPPPHSNQVHAEVPYTAVRQPYHVPPPGPGPDAAQRQAAVMAAVHGPMQAPPTVGTNSHVVQVGNFLQVVPADLSPDVVGLMATVPPPPPVVSSRQQHQQQQSVVLQTGNILQVIPGEQNMAPQKVVQVGNMLEVVPAAGGGTPGKRAPTPADVGVPGRLPAGAALAAPLPQSLACPKSLVSLPLPPLPLAMFSSPPSPFLRDASAQPPPESPAPVSPAVGEAQQLAEAELRREQKEKRRQEKERRRQEKENKKRNKLKLATGNIIKKALQQDCNLLDDSHEVDMEDMKLIEEAIVKVAELEDEQPLSPVPKKKKAKRTPLDFKALPAAGKGILVFPGFSKEKLPAAEDNSERKTVKFADGIRPGEGTSPSAGEDLPSPPPPPRKLPKEKRFKKKKKKKKIKVKIIRQINMEDDEEDDDDDDISPPPPPPGSPPRPPVYPAGYPAFPAAGFIYSQAPQYTVLSGDPVTTSVAGGPGYAPLYHQHHHTTTTTHTTTVQFAPPPPPLPPGNPSPGAGGAPRGKQK